MAAWSDPSLTVLDSPLSQLNSDGRRTYTGDSSVISDVDGCSYEEDLVSHINSITDSNNHLMTKYKWCLNYQEAAVYLQEGENNDKYDTHPSNYDALPAYQVAHNYWFHILDLFASILLLSLALCESPAVTNMALPVGVHSSLELFCLLILALILGIRLKWLKFRTFFKHKRTVLKMFLLLVMLVEAFVMICRQKNHLRVTRAVRPFFLMDSYYCKGVRRFTRQIFQSLRPIFDMLLLLLFFMLIFSILGFYLFSDINNYTYFSTIQDSFVSLFVLLTTANYPDVMMPAYNESRFYVAFFIIYLSLELFFLMNLLLAVVYDKFSSLEKEKLRKLFFHKRLGCRYAFQLLVSRQHPATIQLKHFQGMMQYLRPKMSRKDVYLTFKSMNVLSTGSLSLTEFFTVYGCSKLKWKPKNVSTIWSEDFRYPFNLIFRVLHRIVTHKCFEYYIYLTIASNFTWIVIETVQMSVQHISVKKYDFTATGVTVFFIYIYVIEACLKILGKGPREYFTTGWDLFDFFVTLVSIIGLLGEIVNHNFYYIMVLRPFRLLRLFKINRRYRDVLGTFFVIFSRLVSIALTIMMLYYFFGIIGMELIGDVDLTNCCKNTSVEDFYREDNSTSIQGFYYLNNFQNILYSGVTLFELTVVNNWFIIMEGYANAVSEWLRLYFMLFYIVSMVVMNIVVAFVLDAFLFRIQYKRTMNCKDIEDESIQQIDIPLSQRNYKCTKVIYQGERHKNREDFSLQMYQDEVTVWLEEEVQEHMHAINYMKNLQQRNRDNSANLEDFSVNDSDTRHLTLTL
ncbi:two pore calcium channel protein 1-like [Octopus sinensis]|uniref:Two pore calcium channel protein 1-like n=1 Tax=Octopus sinensis TaxID=2607531 RepID=A0A6P7SWS8_9MOLL|nr:two pore calcium channel protein 1-like [Octopus sinensis]